MQGILLPFFGTVLGAGTHSNIGTLFFAVGFTMGRQEGLPHLVPYLCALDTISVEWMGSALY